MQIVGFHGFAYTCCTASFQPFCGMSAIRYKVLNDRTFPQVCYRTLVEYKGSGFLGISVVCGVFFIFQKVLDDRKSVIKPDKCCKTYMLYVVYQYNIISCVLSKKQDRNKINNLSDSSLFTFHLVSSFALGCTKMFFKPFSPTTSRSSENILLKRIDELLQPKEKMSKSISSDYIRRNFYYPQR